MTGSRRSVPLPPGWEKIRARILRRDGDACQWRQGAGVCGARANEVDHIVPAHLGGGDDDGNLRSLCGPHHRYTTSADAGRTWAAMRRDMIAKRTRPPERHPGLIR